MTVDPPDPPERNRSDPPEGGAPTIFVSDASAEADRLSAALRGRGYRVVEVPLSMLVARVAVQPQSLILLDADAEGALEAAGRLRDVPGASGIDLLFLGDPGRAMQDRASEIRREGSGAFVRPVDVYALVRKVEALLGPRMPTSQRDGTSTPPPSIHSGKRPSGPPSASPPSRLGALRPSVAPPGSVPISDSPPHDSSRVVTGEARTGQFTTGVNRATPARGLTALTAQSRGFSLAPGSPLSSLLPPGSGALGVSPSSEPHTGSTPAAHDPSAWALAPAGTGARVPVHASLSPEVEGLLRAAEERLGADLAPTSQPPTPEEEVEAVLPADILAALDEPIDADDDAEPSDSAGGSSTPARGTTGTRDAGTGAGTNAGAPQPTPRQPQASYAGDRTPTPERPSVGARVSPTQVAGRPPSNPYPPSPRENTHDHSTPPPPRRGSSLAPLDIPGTPLPPSDPQDPQNASTPPPRRMTPEPPRVEPTRRSAPPSERPAPPPRAPTPSLAPAPRSTLPEVLGPGDALKALATCVSGRTTGALCIETAEGIRRIVLREGDIVTAASGIDDESLVSFLCARGDLTAEIADRLRGKLPAYGRHAGAALIAHGHLGQDQLWPVLRSHAEWILGCLILAAKGTCSLDPEPPGRLKAEPSVFGGAPGAEVLLEVARRVIPATTATAALGGARARLAGGPRAELLSECALPEPESLAFARGKGGTLADLLATGASAELATVAYVLVLLGVLETLSPGSEEASPAPASFDPLDEEALRARVRARLGLVEEGDYFALLGVPRSATAYEIKRAYLELRRSFEPTRALTAGTADLADDVRLIVEVLDEAHDILRDQNRRERYKRAIEAGPPR